MGARRRPAALRLSVPRVYVPKAKKRERCPLEKQLLEDTTSQRERTKSRPRFVVRANLAVNKSIAMKTADCMVRLTNSKTITGLLN